MPMSRHVDSHPRKLTGLIELQPCSHQCDDHDELRQPLGEITILQRVHPDHRQDREPDQKHPNADAYDRQRQGQPFEKDWQPCGQEHHCPESREKEIV